MAAGKINGETRRRRLLKRCIDLSVSVPALALTSPLMIGVAIALVRSSGRPILFQQTRAGKGGIPFKLNKFRTMRAPRDGEDEVLSDADRLTGLGKWLRATSIDELPSLLNVIQGNMSLVGPRPLHMRYTERYSEEQSHRLDVRPGITGWAQINGRNSLSWDKKFELDVWYVGNQSLFLDLQILVRTLAKVVRREGIEAEGYATMPEFFGAVHEEPAS